MQIRTCHFPTQRTFITLKFGQIVKSVCCGEKNEQDLLESLKTKQGRLRDMGYN